MSIPQLLHTMCAELSDADLNAIRKARGFSAKETASRTAFASFYLTSLGLAEVMRNLEPAEAVTLRLLHETGPVDISFFERLYGSAGSHYTTFTQQYKATLAEVKTNFVRRGLVVMAEVKTRAETVQMERWRFALPPEFAPYLPPLPGKPIDHPGQQNDATARRKLLELVGGVPAIPNDPQPIHLQNGSIYLENALFSQATFSIWLEQAWERAARVFKPNVPASLSPTQAVIQLLDDQIWRSPKDLEAGILIYSFGGKDISVETLLKQGWELGLLSRLDIDRTPHYRLAPTHPAGTNAPYPATLNWADTTSKPGSVKVDLRLISIHDLDLLNTLTHLAVENGVLLASPSLVKLGRATPAQRRAPLSRWLAENVPAFAKTLETVETKWGKTLLHENLLIAHVRDLSLRVQLERELGKYLIVLNEHHIAFPPAWRAEVEKVLKKAGFVVKTVKA